MTCSTPLKGSYKKTSLTLIMVGLFFHLALATALAQQTGAGSSIENPNNIPPVKQNKKSTQTETKEPSPMASSSSPSPAFYRHALALGLGQTFLFGDFNDLGEDKVTPDLYYIYKASYTFQFLLNFHSNEQKFNGQSIRLTSINLGIKSKLFDFDSFAPFVTGGLGFYWPKAERFINSATQTTTSESKAVMGLNLGAGMDLELNERFTFGLIGHYHYPFRAKQDHQPSLEGHYFKLLLTLAYSFL